MKIIIIFALISLFHNKLQISRTKLQQLIEDGCVMVDENVIKVTKFQVTAGSQITVKAKIIDTPKLTSSEIQLNVVYEDEHLAVIDKHAGICVHPGSGVDKDTIANALLSRFGNSLSHIDDPIRPGIIHRLDKDTSGLMIIAKDNHTHNLLSKMLKERLISRRYLALVKGVPNLVKGNITTYYGVCKNDHKKMSVKRSGEKLAITDYKVLKTFHDTISLVECSLQTGRTHQIRVHMAFKKHPIIGDKLYGDQVINLSAFSESVKIKIKKLRRQFLHAYQIEFEHPVTMELISLESALPNDLQEILDSLNE